MNLWPIITLFGSLILILFFRRIDKRIINFNKFKKYAQKLSDDFTEFLSHKKDELSHLMKELEHTIENASKVKTLARWGKGFVSNSYHFTEWEYFVVESRWILKAQTKLNKYYQIALIIQ